MSFYAWQALAVAGGAVVGAWLRWLAALWLNPLWAGFPLGTLLVNVVGGFLIGMALEWFGRQPNDLLKLLLVFLLTTLHLHRLLLQ